MSEPKKPLITRERYRQYKRDQTTKPVTDEKKVAPRATDAARSAPTTEKNNKQPSASKRERKAVFRPKRKGRKTATKPRLPSQRRSYSGKPTNPQLQRRWSV